MNSTGIYSKENSKFKTIILGKRSKKISFQIDLSDINNMVIINKGYQYEIKFKKDKQDIHLLYLAESNISLMNVQLGYVVFECDFLSKKEDHEMLVKLLRIYCKNIYIDVKEYTPTGMLV